MGNQDTSLSIEERTQIRLPREQGSSCRAIALQPDRLPSMVARELRRNGGHEYVARVSTVATIGNPTSACSTWPRRSVGAACTAQAASWRCTCSKCAMHSSARRSKGGPLLSIRQCTGRPLRCWVPMKPSLRAKPERPRRRPARRGELRTLSRRREAAPDFGAIFSKLTQYGYAGWAVLEWECCIKHPEDGAREGAEFIGKHLIRPADRAFDDFAAGGVDASTVRRVLGLV
jgi:hypothetical protein